VRRRSRSSSNAWIASSLPAFRTTAPTVQSLCRRLILTGLGADTPITVTRQRREIYAANSPREAARAQSIALPI
jgi:hypothetical protein